MKDLDLAILFDGLFSNCKTEAETDKVYDKVEEILDIARGEQK